MLFKLEVNISAASTYVDVAPDDDVDEDHDDGNDD